MQVRDEYRTDYDPDILLAFSLEFDDHNCLSCFGIQNMYVPIMKSNSDSGF